MRNLRRDHVKIKRKSKCAGRPNKRDSSVAELVNSEAVSAFSIETTETGFDIIEAVNIESAYGINNEAYTNTNRDKDADTTEKYTMAAAYYPADDRFEPRSSKEVVKYRIPTDRPVRVYCDGVYDLFHYGHARSLMQAKGLFPNVYLLVGITNDVLTTQYKGATVLSAAERYESVRQCRHVDEVVEDAPWILTDEFLKRHRIDFVAHDDVPYACEGQEDIYAWIKATNRFVPTMRTLGISTTGLITRLIQNYDMYLRRQIRRGITRRELNISYITRLNAEIGIIKKDARHLVQKLEQLSNGWLKSFMHRLEMNRNAWVEKIVGFVKKRMDAVDG